MKSRAASASRVPVHDLMPPTRTFSGRREGRHVLGVVEAADDDGPVRVSALEGHGHLVAHARPEAGTPALAGPELRDANPARFSGRAVVPAELHAHTPMPIDMDGLPCGPDYHSGLCPGNPRPGRPPRGPKRQRRRYASEAVLVAEGALAPERGGGWVA